MFIKKRISSLLLILLVTMSVFSNTMFVEARNLSSLQNLALITSVKGSSKWAEEEILMADSYGIIPKSLNAKNMKSKIKTNEVKDLLNSFKKKIVETDQVVKTGKTSFKVSKKPTVEQVMGYLYDTAASYKFTEDIQFKKGKAVSFMKKNKIYKANKEELDLKKECSIEQALALTGRLIAYLYDKLDISSKGYLWEVKANGNTVYLLGSIHMGSNKTYPLSNKIWTAFNQSDEVAFELNMLNPFGAYELLNLGTYKNEESLKDHLSDEMYEQVISLLQKAGVQKNMSSKMKPWFAYLMLNSMTTESNSSEHQAINSANLGIDFMLTTTAALKNKPINEVEGYKIQANMFDSFSTELQVLLLKSVIEEINKKKDTANDKENISTLDKMLQYWKEGDIENMKQYVSFDHSYKELIEDESKDDIKLIEEFQDKLMTQRDKNMTKYVENLLNGKNKKTYFVVVGCGHLITDTGVIKSLEDSGYILKHVK